MATPYISCPGRVLLGEQQVLSKNLFLSKTITYATSCRNNGQVYAQLKVLVLPAPWRAYCPISRVGELSILSLCSIKLQYA